MNTPQAQPKGCSAIVAVMLATLAFVIGLLLGAGAFFGYATSSSEAAQSIGINDATTSGTTAATPCEEKACPVCPEPSAAGADAAGASKRYALVYPIEQSLRVEGKLDKTIIEGLVLKNRSEIRKCYQDVLNTNPTIAGEMSLQFTVSKSGAILAAVARHDAVQNPTLKSCILNKIKTWKLPSGSVKSKLAVVKLDVVFAPLGG